MAVSALISLIPLFSPKHLFKSMRRVVTLILVAIVALSAFADDNERQFRKIIENCDVADVVMSAQDARSFWTLLQMTNEPYQKTAASLSSNGDRDLKRNMMSLLSQCDYYFTNVPVRSSFNRLSENIIEQSGLRGVNPFTILTVTDETDVASFSYPNGYIFLTGGFADVAHSDSLLMSAFVLSEGAHCVLQHAYAHVKWEKSRRNRINFWRKFTGVALAVGSALAEELSDGRVPIAELGLIGGMALVSSTVNNRYYMTYTPEQIFEADIVAYRFMQWSGVGGRTYIDALRRVGYHVDANTANDSDFPTLSRRIALLEYLDAHPELRQKVKASQRRPRQVPSYTRLWNTSNYR